MAFVALRHNPDDRTIAVWQCIDGSLVRYRAPAISLPRRAFGIHITMKISDTDPLHADSPSADSQSAVGPSSSPNNNRSPNNPFRYPNALGASSPLPYETHISNPFANNNSGYNNSTKQEYPDEKLKSQLYRGDNSYHEQQPPPSYPAPHGSPPQQIYAPPMHLPRINTEAAITLSMIRVMMLEIPLPAISKGRIPHSNCSHNTRNDPNDNSRIGPVTFNASLLTMARDA